MTTTQTITIDSLKMFVLLTLEVSRAEPMTWSLSEIDNSMRFFLFISITLKLLNHGFNSCYCSDDSPLFVRGTGKVSLALTNLFMSDQFLSNPKIADLNDRLRKSYDQSIGVIVFCPTVSSMVLEKPELQLAIVRACAQFDDFNEENDPYGEHDFGTFSLDDNHFNFKIDYYARDSNYSYGSESPESIEETQRILTIMDRSNY